MKRFFIYFLLCATAFASEKVRILRDEFGVPHIFASTPAGAAYGAGYAQAEDRLEEMLRNYRKAEGTMSEVFGESYYKHDYRQRLWRHRQVAQEHYKDLKPEMRAMCEAFMSGVKKFMGEHPEQVPAWAPKLEPWHIIALGRYIIWGWPEGEAGGDLLRGGIQPDPVAYHGSNEWLIAPGRTAMHVPIAFVDPHLSWYGEFRFYEMRMYGGALEYSGASILGMPFSVLGHSRYTSVAMTTGGPDTSDIFEEEVRGKEYKFRGEWRSLKSWTEKIGVKAGDKIDWKDVTYEYTHHGPIVAHKNGKAYSAAIPYADAFQLMQESWDMVTAHDLSDMKKALGELEFMAQNIMVGTVDGDIYYVRNGRVPIRAKGCDPSKPMPGTGECEWQGIHPFEDLVQVTNPPQGYMQNCNISPWVMMKNSPLDPDKYAEHPYIYNAGRTPAHQRAAMTLEQLDAAKNVTLEQAIDIAFSPEVYKAETWQERIRKAVQGSESAKATDSEFVQSILDWNRRSDADSRGALAYYLFKMELGSRSKLLEPPAELTDDDVRAALHKAEEHLKATFPPNAVFGTVFRVGRTGSPRNWPVGGGSLAQAGMATPRALGFDPQGNLMIGRSGQTSTQIVILTKPPQSWMVIPLGESDRADSAHFDDQAEKLFSKSRMKPTYFLRPKELEKHVIATEELTY